MSILFPEYMTAINDKISIRSNMSYCYLEVLYLMNDVVFFRHIDKDKESFRFIIYQLIANDLATPTELNKALGLTRSTIYNWIKKFTLEEEHTNKYNIHETYLKSYDLNLLQNLFDKGFSFEDIEYLQGLDVELINEAIWEEKIIENKGFNKNIIYEENHIKPNNISKTISSKKSPIKNEIKIYL